MPGKYIKQLFAFCEWRVSQFILFSMPKSYKGCNGCGF